jgi:hypothetical protein
LTGSELNQMAVGIANHGEIADHSADILRRFHENVLRASQLSVAIDFRARFSLKADLIEAHFHLILN